MATEEHRAAEYRRTMAARTASTSRRERLLAGSPSARLKVIQAWWPWTLPQPTAADAPDSDLVN